VHQEPTKHFSLDSSSQSSKKQPIKKTSFPNKNIYLIVWRDAYSEVDEWHDENSLDSQDYICHTIGYLIQGQKKSNYYTIASTNTCDGYYCAIIHIPKSMIISKQKIELP